MSDPRPEQLISKLISLGEEAADREDFREAVRLFSSVRRLAPDEPYVLYSLGIYQRANGEFEEARRTLLRCTEMEPDKPDVWYALGNTYRSLDDLPRSIEAYRKSLLISPSYLNALNNLALSLREDGQLEESELVLGTALTLYPSDPDLLYNLASLHKSQNDCRSAITLYLKALENDPDYYSAWEDLANCYEEIGLHGDALEARLNASRLES